METHRADSPEVGGDGRSAVREEEASRSPSLPMRDMARLWKAVAARWRIEKELPAQG
jgi:hypothetical protein